MAARDPQPADVGGANMGDQGVGGLSHLSQAANFSGASHGHFQNHKLMLRLHLEQGLSNPDVVVVVGLTFENCAVAG
jgi:hypothetical protein